jgi:NAD(P)-dependent dehydrogenase (short-subunit alcohol dehydrogenase family)
MNLDNKIAIVTGAGQGIGKAIAIRLANAGADVAIMDLNMDAAAAVAQEIEGIGRRSLPVQADVSQSDDVNAAVEKVISTLGRVDILVNNVGAARNADILALVPERIDEALALKTYSYLRMSQLVIPYMREKRWGRIINIAGAAGTSPTRGNIPTGAANITILNITRALSDAVAADGISVNTVCPGLTNTGRARTQQRARAEREGRDVEELLQALGQELPAGRIAEPEEIANVVTFLASKVCSYMFGSALYMDGGKRRATP